MKAILILNIIILSLVDMGCSQNRTYLTERDIVWNPYSAGQVLIFQSNDGAIDTIAITQVEDKRFPDGLGAETNERLRVLAKLNNRSNSKVSSEVRFLYIVAKTPKDSSQIDFELSIGNGAFWGKYFSIPELEEYKEEYLELPYKTFTDVIRVDDNSSQIYRPNDIATIFWSKSAGYVKCEKKDGTTWELLNIIESR
jgi:hypothetical protein